MSNQPRVIKVLTALLVSMTIGTIILIALGNKPPSAGAFCLSSYYKLDPIENAVASSACQSPDRWNSIQIFYSRTPGGDINRLALLSGIAPEQLNCHFVICNGRSGKDGRIQATQRWQRQWSISAGKNWYGSGQTIRICLIGDGQKIPPTDYQMKRLELLVKNLCRKFRIQPQKVYYPKDFR